MSLEKVNAYRENKVNRKAQLKAARRKKARNKIIGWVVVVAIAGGLLAALVVTGVNIYSSYKAGLPNYDAESLVIGQYIEHTTEAESTEAETDEAESEEETTEAETTEAETTEAESEEETTEAETTEEETTAAN